MQKQPSSASRQQGNRNVLQGKNGRMNATKSNAAKLTAPPPTNTPSRRSETQAPAAVAPARMGWTEPRAGSPRVLVASPTAIKSTLHADAAPWIGSSSPSHAAHHHPTGRWGDDALEHDMNPYGPYSSIAPTVWSAPAQWNGNMYAQTQLYQQPWQQPDGRALFPAPTSAWEAPSVRILKRDEQQAKSPRVTPAQIQAILSPRSSNLKSSSPRASTTPKHVAFDGQAARTNSPSSHSRPSTPRQRRQSNPTPAPQPMTKAQKKEADEILNVLSGDEGDNTRRRPAKLQLPKSPRSQQAPKQQKLSKAQRKEQEEILAIFSDGDELPRDRKKVSTRKQPQAKHMVLSPRGWVASPGSGQAAAKKASVSPRQTPSKKASFSKAQKREQDEILAIFSDGDELPRDRKTKTARKQQAGQAKHTTLSPRGWVASPRGGQPAKQSIASPRSMSPSKKQQKLTKAQKQEHEEILAIFSDGDELPRDRSKKVTTRKAATAPRGGNATPKKQQKLSKAQQQEQLEILAIFSDGDELPRDRKAKKTLKKQPAPSPRNAQTKKHASVASPRGSQASKQSIASPRTAPKKQQKLSKAQQQEQAEILAIFSDGDELPRDRKAKKAARKNQIKQQLKQSVASPRGSQSSKQSITSPRNEPKKQQKLSKAQQQEQAEIFAIFSDGDELPRDRKKQATRGRKASAPANLSTTSPRAQKQKQQKLSKAQQQEQLEIFAIFSDGDELPRDRKATKAAPRKQQAKIQTKQSVVSPRGSQSSKQSISSPRTAPKKQQKLSKTQQQEQAEILAIFSDGDELPRDRKAKKASSRKQTAKQSVASPRGSQSSKQPRNAPKKQQKLSKAQQQEQAEILAIFSDGDELPRDRKAKKAAPRKQQTKQTAKQSVASPRGSQSSKQSIASPRNAPKKQQKLSKAQQQEQAEILAIFSDGDELPRDRKAKKAGSRKQPAKQNVVSPRPASATVKKAALSPRISKQQKLSKSQQQEQAEILAIFSDGEELPRDRKAKKAAPRKQPAKQSVASPRGSQSSKQSVSSPRTAPKKQQKLSKAQQQEQAEILAIFSDGEDLPRDRKAKKAAPRKQSVASPRGSQSSKQSISSPRTAPKKQQKLSKAQQQEQAEILAIFSDGDELPRDRKANKAGSRKQPAKQNVVSPRPASATLKKAALSPRISVKKQPQQKLSKAQQQEQLEILAIFSDGDELPRDRKAKKTAPRKNQTQVKRVVVSPTNRQAATLTASKPKVKPLTKAQRQEQEEILAIFSDGDELPRDFKAKRKAAKKARKASVNYNELHEILSIMSGDEAPVKAKAVLTKRPSATQHKVGLNVSNGGGTVVVMPLASDAAAQKLDNDGFEAVKSRRTLHQEKKKEHAAAATSSGLVCHVSSHKASGCTCARLHDATARARSSSGTNYLAQEYYPPGRAPPTKTVWTRPAKQASPSPPRSAEKNAQILKSLGKALREAATPVKATPSPKHTAKATPIKATPKPAAKATPTKAAPIATTAAIKSPPKAAAHIHVAKKGARATLST
ncbi:hypothetical protein, variant [Saprolegnia diclina VS20]|uniref:Uncharacterized protein n=1 Tax=Saprolegnia diclina (strain VS20) TaxID=1156394 RepID=T0S4S0_SAPDV|nr:hypothetical protein, variant [Saprolegnia diclina VS20]EQC40048.1 hypothetical protein, variant [Saprolegnia diclina VS20]|eukprot:XP_008606522.1 hypothetical protein, variant [Saprolegnia diclina VS20]